MRPIYELLNVIGVELFSTYSEQEAIETAYAYFAESFSDEITIRKLTFINNEWQGENILKLCKLTKTNPSNNL